MATENRVESAFQNVKVEENLFSVYCKDPLKSGLNAVGEDNIKKFMNDPKHSFNTYMKIKTGGIDAISRMSVEELEEKVDKEYRDVICSYLTGKDVVSCMRWFVRGLSLGDSIRKVQVDSEVNENAILSNKR